MQLTCEPQMLMVIFKKNVKWQKKFPPVFYDGKFIVDFKEKRKGFNTFCETVFTTVFTVFTLPLHSPSKNIANVHFTSDDIRKMIRKLKSTKPQSYDMVRTRVFSHGMVSTRVLRVYDKSICKPLEIIFKALFQVNQFFHLN